MRRTLRFLAAASATSLKASFAMRGAFWARVLLMTLNNLIFFVMWWVVFDRYEEIRGWRLADMAAIYGICAGAFGLAVAFGGGVRELARVIAEGDLDTFLTQPKNALLQAVSSHSEAAGWGDVLSAIPFFVLSGYVTWTSVPVVIVGILCGAAVFVASGVLLHSIAFWMGNTQSLSRQMWEFVIMFSLYPKTVFAGWVKLFLFTVIPAGLCAYLPVDMLREFHWTTLVAAVGGASCYVLLAYGVFALGLRRYESGNRFGVRA